MRTILVGIIVGIAVGIISTVGIFYILHENYIKEDVDLEQIRQINEIVGCVELKKEYQLIKRYESVLNHSDLYIQAIKIRAEEIFKTPLKCEYDK